MIGAITAGVFSAPSAPVTSSYESIATQTVGSGGTASISFTSIPATFKHLQIRYLARTAAATVNDGSLAMQLNSDTGSNYLRLHYLQGDGSTAYAGVLQIPWPDMFSGCAAGNNAAANIFGAGVIDLLDYTSTNKVKVIRHLSGIDANGAGKANLGSASWATSGTAVSTITIGGNGFANNLLQYSSFALYGIKG